MPSSYNSCAFNQLFTLLTSSLSKLKPMTSEPHFHFWEEMVIAWRQGGTVWLVIKNFPLETVQQGCCSGSCMGPCVILQKRNASDQPSSSFVLDRSSKVFEGLTVSLRVNRVSWWHEVDQKNSPTFPEDCCHPLPIQERLLEFFYLLR